MDGPRVTITPDSGITGVPARSSISDGGAYLELCEAAADGGLRFQWFRSHPAYREILEHVTPDQGRAYLQLIAADVEVAAALPGLVAADVIGHPRRARIGGLGRVSPTTLRYVKVLTDLRRLFGPLDGLRISEIGIGYGGQARILTSFHRIEEYALFDLPPVLRLARRFQASFPDVPTRFTYSDGRDPQSMPSDLIISNYAFSELRREVQEAYLERVILGVPRGYLTYNHISPPGFRTLTASEFAGRIPGAELLAEEPLTHPDNVLVVWGHGR